FVDANHTYGHTMSYEEVAQALDKPRAVRAVAHAIAKNPIAYLIPCHRVMYKNGRIGAYRWGAARKKALLAWEAASSSE
ncbi:MAG: MGMT family protein, partial [Candidatus Babeliales bacterium]